MARRRRRLLVIGCVLLVAACWSNSDQAGDTTTPEPVASTSLASRSTSPSTSAPAAPTSASPVTIAATVTTVTTASTTADEPSPLEQLVASLAADQLDGRDNGTDGSAAARELLIGELAGFAAPVPGTDSFEHEFADGVNVIGFVPGTEIPDEFVLIGAHYDHLSGPACNGQTAGDTVCNGATDNAAGVAAAMSAARSIAAAEPRRSLVIALWDAEEDGLLGSRHYVENPLVPLGDTVAYLNLDILGSNLLPSLGSSTLVIGAETGGAELVDAVAEAFAASSLDPAVLSLAFGQGRSDHAPFAAAGVPVAFFGDATNGCYHTVADDVEAVDFRKLREQADVIGAVGRRLASSETLPVFATDLPVVTYDDAVALLGLIQVGEADIGLLDGSGVDLESLMSDLGAVVDAGPSEFDADAIGTAVNAALGLVTALEAGPCPGR